MFRRQFIAGSAIAGGCAFGSAESTLVMHVSGFSCPTCAVGLETLLSKEAGVLRAAATYPEGNVTIVYRPETIAEPKLRNLIKSFGFGITDGPQPQASQPGDRSKRAGASQKP
jgi:hypothetical protein